MSEFTELAKTVIGIAKDEKKKGTSPYDVQGEVKRIDREKKIAIVEFAGTGEQTPVKLTINAKKGDKVKVRVSGHTAWITGNMTSPPTDDSNVLHIVNGALGGINKSITNIEGNIDDIEKDINELTGKVVIKITTEYCFATARAIPAGGDFDGIKATGYDWSEEIPDYPDNLPAGTTYYYWRRYATYYADETVSYSDPEFANDLQVAHEAEVVANDAKDVADTVSEEFESHTNYFWHTDNDGVYVADAHDLSGSSINVRSNTIAIRRNGKIATNYAASGINFYDMKGSGTLTDDLLATYTRSGISLYIQNAESNPANKNARTASFTPSGLTFWDPTDNSNNTSQRKQAIFGSSGVYLYGTINSGGTITNPELARFTTSGIGFNNSYDFTIGNTSGSYIKWLSSNGQIEIKANSVKIGSNNVATVNQIPDVSGKADKSDANYKEQVIYKQAVLGTSSMSGTTTWVTETGESVASDTTGQTPKWTTKRPTYRSNYPVLFVATQRQTVTNSGSNTCTCTTPLIDDTETVIDGGHIIANSITAGQLNTSSITLATFTNDKGFITGDGVITKNLVVNPYFGPGFVDNQSQTGWTKESSNTLLSYDSTNDRLIITCNSSYYGITQAITVKRNTDYVISVDAGASFNINFGTSQYSSGSLTWNTADDGRKYTVVNSGNYTTRYLYVYATSSVPCYVNKIKIEEGSVYTGWNADDVTQYVNATSGGIKIGKASVFATDYVNIDSDGLTVFDNSVNVANFGSTSRIGPTTSAHMNLTSSRLELYYGNRTTDPSFTIEPYYNSGSYTEYTTTLSSEQSSVNGAYLELSGASGTNSEATIGAHSTSYSSTIMVGVRDIEINANRNVSITNGSFGVTNGTATFNKKMYAVYGASDPMYSANCHIGSDGYVRVAASSSSRRYKRDIEDINEERLDPHKLYNLRVVQFRYKEDYIKNIDANNPYQYPLLPGLIAEEVYDVYPSAVEFEDGQIETWDAKLIVPPMLKLIQEQKQLIDDLTARVSALEN